MRHALPPPKKGFFFFVTGYCHGPHWLEVLLSGWREIALQVGWTVTCSGGASMLGPAGVVEWMQLAGSCWSASDGLAKEA